jgi:hypothetical protein
VTPRLPISVFMIDWLITSLLRLPEHYHTIFSGILEDQSLITSSA